MPAFLHICFAVLVGSLIGSRDAETDVVARVDGAQIVRRELEFALTPFAAQVARLRGGEDASDIEAVQAILDAATEDAVTTKLQLLLAAENGIIDNASYTAFRGEWENDARARREARSNGQVVYGPESMSEQAFFDYWLNVIVKRLKEEVVAKDLDLSDRAIEDAYRSMREQEFRRPDRVRLLQVSIGSADPEDLREIRTDLEGTSDPEVLMARHRCRARIIVIDVETESLVAEELGDLMSVARSLTDGVTSSWQPKGEEMHLFYCLERGSGGYLSLEEARGIVRTRLLEQGYRELLAGRRGEATVVINDRGLSAVRNALLEAH